MNKNIKYAGLATAALLLVAPAAAPAVNSLSNVTTAQAATNNGNLTDAQTASLNKFFGVLQASNPSSATNKFPDFTDVATNYTSTKLTYTQLIALTSVASAMQSTILPADVTNLASVTFGVQGVRDGSVLSNVSDFNTYVKTAAANPGDSVTLRITAYDSTGAAVGTKDLTFTNTPATQANNTLALTYTDPMKVALNSGTDQPLYTTSVDATVQDGDGNTIAVTNPTPDGTLYTSADAAWGSSTASGATFTGNTFSTPGATYYQKVTVTLPTTANLGTIYSSMQAGTGGSVTINGNDAVNANVNTTNNTLTYLRSIKVGQADNWTTTPVSGVVTVGSSIAPLCDDAGDVVATRSLAPNTPWLTDQKRVNSQTGEVQYRVSTHEWVAA